jgi:CheY-like chemotaxis protein
MNPHSRMVLIADDDSAIRLLVPATLASDQYSVIEAADGEEAWRLIREHHPAVAILDWEMPVYSGLELTAVTKGDPQARDIMVIMPPRPTVLAASAAQTAAPSTARSAITPPLPSHVAGRLLRCQLRAPPEIAQARVGPLNDRLRCRASESVRLHRRTSMAPRVSKGVERDRVGATGAVHR